MISAAGKRGEPAIPKISNLPNKVVRPVEPTYRIQALSRQHSFRRSLYTSTIAVQIPHYITPTQLWEHLRYLIDLRRGKPETIVS